MTAIRERVKFPKTDWKESLEKPSQFELDQRLADEQFVAWVMGTGYAAGHLPETDPPEPRPARHDPMHRVQGAVRKAGDRVIGGVALAWLGVMGDRKT